MSVLSKINIFDNNWVDLVFKGRNQAYGAYVLRKKSSENTNKGIVFSIIFFTLIISTPMLIDWIKGFVPEEPLEKSVTTEVALKDPPPVDKNEPPPPPVEEPPPLKSTVKFTPPVIKPDEEVTEPPVAQVEMEEKEASTETVEGDPNGVDASLLESGTGDLAGEAEPEIVTFAEQMPEFPDGDLYAYLSKTIQYPTMARENGIESRVVVQFVVERDGSITDVTVVKKAGWGMDEEAVRVVKNMKPWKPAKQNGKPVRLKYTLPIAFKLN